MRFRGIVTPAITNGATNLTVNAGVTIQKSKKRFSVAIIEKGKTVNFKLDPEKKEKWLKALRSGRYKQGRSKLRKKVSKGKYEYCCLGVYANVCGMDWKPVLNFNGDETNSYTVDPEYPDSWTIKDGQYIPFEMIPLQIQRALSGRNDTSQWSFKQIADWIEKEL